MNPIRPLSVFAALLTAAIAQVPTDAAVVLESGVVNGPNYTYVDVLGRGITPVPGQSVFLQPPPLSVSADPVAPGNFFFLASTASLPGVWRCDVGLLGRITLTVWGAWLTTGGDRLEIGATRVFTLRGGLVESFGKPAGLPGPGTALISLSGAIDLAVREPLLYVLGDASSGHAVVEYHLGTGVQRSVGNYPGARAIAVSPVAPELCLGFPSGDLQRIDVATGTVTTTTATGSGAIVAVGYSRFGTVVWADSTQLWSELAPSAPLFTAATTIRDFGVSGAPVATATPFGRGCGNATAASWTVNGAPTLGNAAFTLGLQDGVPASFAVLALGTSRVTVAASGLALPLDLQPLGANGCQLLADPQVLVLRPTDVFGDASQALPIPNGPGLAGIEVVGQWFQPDAAVGSFGFATTAGLACVLQ